MRAMLNAACEVEWLIGSQHSHSKGQVEAKLRGAKLRASDSAVAGQTKRLFAYKMFADTVAWYKAKRVPCNSTAHRAVCGQVVHMGQTLVPFTSQSVHIPVMGCPHITKHIYSSR
jgi:hypothetical protein